jgi:PAS domain S-box-containing protein
MGQLQEERSKSLRQRAEEVLDGNLVDLEGFASDDIQSLIHDLQVHQVELTLQNEELRRIQVELEASRNQYSDLYNYAPAGYCTINRKDRILEANKTLADLMGVSQGKMIGSQLSEFVERDNQDKYYLYRQQAFKDEHQFTEIWMVKLSGDRVYVRLESKLDPTDKNRLMVMMSDITGRKQAEEAQQASEERLLLATTGAKVGIWDWDLVTDELKFDGICKALYGLDGDTAPSLAAILNTIHPADRRIKEQHIAKMCQELELSESEYRVIWPDGSLHWILDAGRRYADSQGNQVRITGIAKDITRQKLHEEQLKENAADLENLNRELKNFTTIASHDLQEPLRKIRSFGDQLKTRPDNSEKLSEQEQDYIERMLDAAKRMQTMIDSLLAYSRVTEKVQPSTPVNMTQTVREVLSDLEVLIERCGGKVELSDLGVIEADPHQMQQLFQNLISNALKFTKPGIPACVKIYAQTRPSENSGPELINFYVEDQGIGIDKAQAGRLFQPFSRLVGRSAYEGHGIGLAICRKIVEGHGGSLTFESAPGEGTIFIVTLPSEQNH